MEKKLEVLRIGIFYDGYYFYKISNYYNYFHERKARIDITKLHEFIRKEVAALTRMELRKCQIIDAHYFKGRSLAKNMGEDEQATKKALGERSFEDILMRENIVCHYLPLDSEGQEKGIDVLLALEAYELAILKHLDILVLIAGDGDYVPLVRKLHTLGTQVMLICWDYSYQHENGNIVETKTSRRLLSEVFYPVQMNLKIDEGGSDVNDLFVSRKFQEAHYAEPDDWAVELVSTIFSINTSEYGFIKDEKRNNVYFHKTNLTNCDFSQLRPGMKVSYLAEKDEDLSKQKETPCYRATKVALVKEPLDEYDAADKIL